MQLVALVVALSNGEPDPIREDGLRAGGQQGRIRQDRSGRHGGDVQRGYGQAPCPRESCLPEPLIMEPGCGIDAWGRVP